MNDNSTEADRQEWVWMERKAWRLAQRLIELGTPTEWCEISSEANAKARAWLEAYAPCQIKLPCPAEMSVRRALLARLRHALVRFAEGRIHADPVDPDGGSFDYYAVLVYCWEDEFQAKWESRDPGLIPFDGIPATPGL